MKKRLPEHSWTRYRNEGCNWRMRCGQELDNYICTWEPGKRRSGCLNAKICQLAQSRNTKAENLEHDFNEIVAKIRELGWSDGKRVTR